jgi:hypothetical protein
VSRRSTDRPRRRTAGRQRVLPAVNLLSESAFARMAARRLRIRFAAAGVALVLLVGAAWAAQHVRVTEARKLVAVEQAETTRLTSQTQVLAPVRAFVTGVAAQEATVDSTMSREAYLSGVVDGIRDATPEGAELASIAVTIAGVADGASAADPAASACPGPDPFNTRVVIGCVTLSGTAASRAEVGEMVVRLGDSGLFVEPFISTTTAADSDEVTFSGSVGVSEKAYSRRYGDPTPADAATPTEGGAS